MNDHMDTPPPSSFYGAPYSGLFRIPSNTTLSRIYIYIKLASMTQYHTHKWVVEFQHGSVDIGSLGYAP